MKNLLKHVIVCAITMTTCYNCSVEPVETVETENLTTLDETPVAFDQATVDCTNDDPQAKLINNSLLAANIEVFNHAGALLTHAYDIPSGSESPVLSFNDGIVTFVISTSQSSKIVKINMDFCMLYQVEINENNQLDTDVPMPL